MTECYDDNFGHWDIEDEDDLVFYRQVQRENVKKICSICDRTVMLRPDYDKCGSCCDSLESGLLG